MIKFMEIISKNSTYTQKQIAKDLGCSDSTNERYTNDMNNESPNNKKKLPTLFNELNEC